MTDLVVGTPVTENYTGSAVEFSIPSGPDRKLSFEIWGAGGGGGTANNNTVNQPGGAGGATWGWYPVVAGDTVKVEVGQGGQKGTQSPNAGGLGGWPDGGNGGRGDVVALGMGGGGGSTRLYINNVLVAVAGAGGGGLVAGSRIAGVGGGASGAAGSNAAGNGVPGGGGTQSAGGAAGTNAVAGASLQGGNGYSVSVGSNTVASRLVGGGGGGGYYGGGGGGGTSTSPFGPGGGGSGYFKTGIGGSVQTAAGTTDTAPSAGGHKPSGAGAGGISGGTDGTTYAGGDGAAYLNLEAYPDLPLEEWAGVSTTGSSFYTAKFDGTLQVKAWGAGGGGGTRSTSTSTGHGGPGGMIDIQVKVYTDDLVELVVGEGGPGAVQGNGVLTARAAPGGGAGNSYNSSGTYFSGGGGGGFSALKINGEYVAVAGAGGGGMGNGTTATSGRGGPGGGTTGGAGRNTSGTAAVGGGGQSGPGAGGIAGSEYQGADSFITGSTAATTRGGGGGGGKYGGNGGAGTVSGGGGGSSWYDPDNDDVILFSTYQSADTLGTVTAANDSDPQYPGNGVGVGGNASTNAAGVAGGTGYIAINFYAGAPGNASGSIPDVTITGLSATGTIPAEVTEAIPGPVTVTGVEAGIVTGTPAGDIGTINLTAISGVATPIIVVDIPGPVNVESRIEASPATDAFITVDILNTLDAIPTVTFIPEATAAGVAEGIGGFTTVTVTQAPGATAGGDGAAAGDIGTINGASPEAYAGQATPGDIGTVTVNELDAEPFGEVTVYGDLGTINLTAPDGIGETPIAVEGDLVTISVSKIIEGEADEVYIGTGNIGEVSVLSFDAMAAGDAEVEKSFPAVILTPPTSSTEIISPGEAGGEIGSVDLTPPTGLASDQEIVLATTLPLPDIKAQSLISAVAIGDGRVSVSLLSTTTITVPTVEIQADVLIEVFPDWTLTIDPPSGVTEHSVNVAVPIGVVTVNKINGYTNINPEFPGDALGAPFDPIVVSGPLGISGGEDGDATGDLPVLYVVPPDGLAVGDATTLADLTVIYVSTIEAETIVDGEGSGDIPAIILAPPAGTPEAGAEVSGDLTVIYITTAEAEGAGEALGEGEIGSVYLYVMEVDIGVSATTSPDFGTPIRVIPVTALAFGTTGAYGEIGTVMVSPPEAEVQGDQTAIGNIGTILVNVPVAEVSHGQDFTVPIDLTISITRVPEGFGGLAVFAAGDIGTVNIIGMRTTTGELVDTSDALIRNIESFTAFIEE